MPNTRKCNVCGTEYKACFGCERVTAFTPWKKITCSRECYQIYLAYLVWRDQGKDSKLFAETVDRVTRGNLPVMPEYMTKVYDEGKTALKTKKEKIPQTNKQTVKVSETVKDTDVKDTDVKDTTPKSVQEKKPAKRKPRSK